MLLHTMQNELYISRFSLNMTDNAAIAQFSWYELTIILYAGLRAHFTNADQAWTKFKFDLDLSLAIIFVASMQFRSNHELNSV